MPTTRLSVAKDKLKFVLLEGIHQTAIDALEQDGYSNIVTHPKALAGDALIEAIADAHFVGIGHIGTQIGVLAEQLGMTVVFHDVEAKLPLGNARQLPVLDALLAAADVVSLHVPETAETKNMIGAEQLARMKQGSHLINASP